jgi:hypothetical protein
MSAAPRKTLIFHIGDHKTGSTSIQLAFARGHVTLQDRQVFYPAKLANNAWGRQCMKYGLAQTPGARERAARPITALADQVRKSDADFVLISAEYFESVPASVLRDVVDTCFADAADDIRVICYVRPHAARVTSSFAERTKAGGRRLMAGTMESFFADTRANDEFIYLPRFLAWRDHFGDKFTLRPMIREQLRDGSVVDDFVHHAFGGLPFTIAGDSTSNESLFLEDLMRLKVLQRTLRGDRDLRLKVGWEFARLVGHMPPPRQSTKLRLHRSLAEAIHAAYIEDARNMDEAFFGGAPLLQQELVKEMERAPEEEQSVEPEDYLSASELRSLEVMSQMVANLLENDGGDWGQYLHSMRVRDVQLARKAAAE